MKRAVKLRHERHTIVLNKTGKELARMNYSILSIYISTKEETLSRQTSPVIAAARR